MAKTFDMGRAPLKESLAPSTVGGEKPSPYAYEHKVTLNSEDMGKLGISEPQVGDVFHVLGEGHVTSVDQTERDNGEKQHTVSVQMKRMAMNKKKAGGESALGAVSKGISEGSQDEGE
jgi:hypothetical protein